MAGQITDFLKLIPLQDIEPELTWEDFCQNPYLLLKAFATYFAVEGKFLQNLPLMILSSTVPSAADRSKIWIKTSKPYAIGIFADGSYQMDYGPSSLRINVPFLANPLEIDPQIQGLIQMSDEDVTQFGIPQTTASAGTRYRWYIFQPGEITI